MNVKVCSVKITINGELQSVCITIEITFELLNVVWKKVHKQT